MDISFLVLDLKTRLAQETADKEQALLKVQQLEEEANAAVRGVLDISTVLWYWLFLCEFVVAVVRWCPVGKRDFSWCSGLLWSLHMLANWENMHLCY